MTNTCQNLSKIKKVKVREVFIVCCLNFCVQSIKNRTL